MKKSNILSDKDWFHALNLYLKKKFFVRNTFRKPFQSYKKPLALTLLTKIVNF